MGPASLRGESVATVSSVDYPGTAVDVGNPHLVCALDGGLEELDLTVPPGHDGTVFPRGVNVEFAVPDGPDRVRMRVHERGVGETRSCGTGTVAVAAAVLGGTGKLTVHVPGGTVHVTIDEHGSTLTGPAVFVARGELDQVWWNGI
jgi:diaminopimelate epimerase